MPGRAEALQLAQVVFQVCSLVLNQAVSILDARPELLPNALDVLADVEFVRTMLPHGATAGIPMLPLDKLRIRHQNVLIRWLATIPSVALVREAALQSPHAMLLGRVR